MELIKRYKVLAAILAAVTAVGVGCWVYQLIFGLTVTGMNNGTSWGLYITNFMFFVGLSAGGLIVASSASVFHITKFKAVALPAIILSTVCICAAGMFVLIDLGGIQRVWRILTGPNPTSPLLWDVCVITCYLIINVLYLVFMTRGNQHAVSIVQNNQVIASNRPELIGQDAADSPPVREIRKAGAAETLTFTSPPFFV